MDEQQILDKLDRIKEIPTLPSVVFELNKYLLDLRNRRKGSGHYPKNIKAGQFSFLRF
jgi:hypothetical protein